MTDFTPQNPDFADVVAASFARQGLMQALGIELAEVGPGRCVLMADRDPNLLQQHGYFHGALIGAMLDSAGGYAAYSLMPPGSEVLTTEYKVNFLTAAEGERLVVRGKVVKPGRDRTMFKLTHYPHLDGDDRRGVLRAGRHGAALRRDAAVADPRACPSESVKL